MDEYLFDLVIYLIIGVISFGLGLGLGYGLMKRYYRKRFISVGEGCEQVESIIPVLEEMENQS